MTQLDHSSHRSRPSHLPLPVSTHLAVDAAEGSDSDQEQLHDLGTLRRRAGPSGSDSRARRDAPHLQLSPSDAQPQDQVALARATRQRLEALNARALSETHNAGLLGQGLLAQQSTVETLISQLADAVEAIDHPRPGQEPPDLAALSDRVDREVAEHEARITQLYTSLARAHTGAPSPNQSLADASGSTSPNASTIANGTPGDGTLIDSSAALSRQAARRTRNNDARHIAMNQQFKDHITTDLTNQLRVAQHRIRDLEESLAEATRAAERQAHQTEKDHQDLVTERDDWQNQFKRLVTEHGMLLRSLD